MVASSTLRSSVVLAVAAPVSAQTWLNPAQDILLPADGPASNPLTLLGANSPWFAGELLPIEFLVAESGC